jgi:arylsulfatase A-like enzyme
MPRNLMLVVWDDIGIDQFPLYCPSLTNNIMPNFEARAVSGVRFTKCNVSPSCAPTRGSFLTGLVPYRHGLGTAAQMPVSLDPTQPTLPKAFIAAGYRTAAVGKWHLALQGGDPAAHALACGFESFEGVWGPGEDYSAGAYKWWTDTATWTNPSTYLTTYTADRAISVLAGLSEPFFLYVCFNAPHSPFHCPPAPLHSQGALCGAGTDAEYYGAMIESLDRECERLFDAVDLSNTTVLVPGDNGTPSPLIRGFPNTQAKGQVYLGGVRAPLIAFGAGVASGEVCSSLVQASDIPATLLELAGVDPKVALPSAVDSVSFAPLLADPSVQHVREFGYAEKFNLNSVPPIPSPPAHDRSAENARYHLIRFSDDSEKMFDVRVDPFELEPLELDQLTVREHFAYDDLRWVIDSYGHVSRIQARKKLRLTLRI